MHLGTLVTILGFIVLISWIGETEKTKRTRMKIEAMLRMEEMAGGYTSGHEGKARMSRQELEKAMKDLDKRLKNLDSIMRERR